MSGPALDTLRRSLEGVVAAVVATCDAEGTPNVSMISQVHYVDPQRVALSYQFFNKTRRNVLATRRAVAQVTDPETFARHRLHLAFEETQTSGPLFETMKAKLAGIASHHGMDKVFRLLGADVYRVLEIEPIPGPSRPAPDAPRSLLAAVRRTCAALDTCVDLDELVDCVTACLERDFGVSHSIVLMEGDEPDRLYAVATRGYPTSGVGAEVALGEGVIGVAAREATPIRVGHMTREYRYGATVSDTARRAGILSEAARVIPYPGLAAPRSQIAVPITDGALVIGVLFAEAEEIMRFAYEDEDALALVALHLGARIALYRMEAGEEEADETLAAPAGDGMVTVRFFPEDQSVFLGNDYLIKGVAGAILWRLLKEHVARGRTEFTTRELRLDPGLRLPSHAENLDARLVLLRKRLDERGACLRIEKCGRGRLRLLAACRVALEEAGA